MAEKNMNAKISVEFEETANRQQLSSGDNLPVLFGKIKKFFIDLKAVAFSGSYNDLSNTPTTATKDTDGLMSAEDKVKLDNADNKYALKSKYGDTTINVGRKAGTTVGSYSTAEGVNTTASGIYSHAEGYYTTASGGANHAEGYYTTTSGNNSHAEGWYTTASGNNSHAEGSRTTASDGCAHAEGYKTTASSTYSHAEGSQTIASGDSSHAEGNQTTANSHFSHAEGWDTTTNGGNSCHAEGYQTTASGFASHVEGSSNNKVIDLIPDFSLQTITDEEIINTWNTQQFSLAHGDSSHVEGSNNLAFGGASHAEGTYTIAMGKRSHTSGCYTKALHDDEAAYGKYNVSNEDTLFSIGDGTADDARHNAFEITTTGGKLHDKDIATTDLIPTTLPANGGNAETVGGKSASDFVEALTDAQTAQTRILIPNDVDVADWLKQNAKIGTVYYRTQNSTGQTNLPPIPDIAWAWFSFDGIRYLCKVMINDYSTRDFLLDNVNFIKGWKEISTTPIYSSSVSGTTDEYGNIALWNVLENMIPISAYSDTNSNVICTPFIGSSNNVWYLAIDSAFTHDKFANTSVSLIVNYITK